MIAHLHAAEGGAAATPQRVLHENQVSQTDSRETSGNIVWRTLRRQVAQVVLFNEGAERGDMRCELGAALGDDGVAQLAAAAKAAARQRRVPGALLALRPHKKGQSDQRPAHLQ